MMAQPKVTMLLERLGIYVAELRRLAAIPKGDLLADPDKVASAKYNFVAAIEARIDIANHVIAAEGFRPPKDNADSFVVLVEKSVLPEAMREHLRSMARFRNRLVHVYWDVDDDLVAEYLHGPLGDLDRFAREISQRIVAPGE